MTAIYHAGRAIGRTEICAGTEVIGEESGVGRGVGRGAGRVLGRF